MATPVRRALVALAFAVAALLACWSPLAAPFGLITGLGAVVLALRARREGGRPALVALVLALLAVAASGWVLGGSAGLWRASRGSGRGPGLSERLPAGRLEEAAEPSREARQRAAEQAVPAQGPRSRN
jgi:hypothetical protein